ncbi:hypothetical protein FH972_021189 [Carpinus fangiana]|uniref:Uncharacterized protein n=1 Tax=Carpinus fangiana TaxID=176857 RepID=A0A5N6KNP2_9ROSI|nr:hypothetical protein FH972_021189 [Carpinus fangiana]
MVVFRRPVAMGLPLWLLFAVQTAANMQYTFTSNGTCPGDGRPWLCDPFSEVICAEETSRTQAYCCPVTYDHCSTGGSTCNGAGGKAGDGQIQCSADGSTWCCSEEYESCTQRANQINVCLHKESNPYVGFDIGAANRTWSSILSASPSATFNAAGISSLMASATSTSTFTSTSTSSTSPTPSTSTTSSESPSSSISSGAIAGIVVGVIVLLVLVAAGVFLFWRRRKAQTVAKDAVYHEVPHEGGEGGAYTVDRKEALPESYELSPEPIPAELGTNSMPHELEAR